MQPVSLKVSSDPFSTGKLCRKPRGRPQWRWKNSGRYWPYQAALSVWYFHTVLGAHTTPGNASLSTRTENNSLVADVSKETRSGGAHQSDSIPVRGTPKKAGEECLP